MSPLFSTRKCFPLAAFIVFALAVQTPTAETTRSKETAVLRYNETVLVLADKVVLTGGIYYRYHFWQPDQSHQKESFPDRPRDEMLEKVYPDWVTDNNGTLPQWKLVVSPAIVGWVLDTDVSEVRQEIRRRTLELSSEGDSMKRLYALHHRGIAWFHAGEPELGIDDLNSATKSSIPYPRIFLSRAVVRMESKRDMETALADVNRWIRENVDDSWGYMIRGQIREKAGQFKLAIADYERAIEVFKAPNNHTIDFFLPAKIRLAWLLATCPQDNLRQPKSALKLAKEVLKATRGYSVWGRNAKAAAHAALSQYKDAVEEQEQSLELFRKFLSHTSYLGEKRFAEGLLKLYKSNRAYRQSTP